MDRLASKTIMAMNSSPGEAEKAALRVDILDSYQQLAMAYEQMNQVLGVLNAQHVPQLTDRLREIERKFGLVYQLFKASVYAIVKDGAPDPLTLAIN